MSGILTKIAHNNRISIGPKDTKLLAEVISTEKRVVEATQKVSSESAKAAVAVKEWGQAEGPDLADILSKVSVLLDYQATAEQTFAEHNNNFRIHFKNIRTREENLAALKRSHASLASKIEAQDKKVSKMKEENKDLPAARERLNELRQEMIGLENSVINEETKLGDYKRATAREALSLKLGALLELAEKSVIIGEIGKLIVDEIPMDRTEPGAPRAMYHGYDRTDELMAEANRCLQDVVFNPMPISAGNPPSAAMQHRMNSQQQDPGRGSQDGHHPDDIRRVGGPTYAGSFPMGGAGGADHSRGNSQSHDGSQYLPAINTSGPLRSSDDAGPSAAGYGSNQSSSHGHGNLPSGAAGAGLAAPATHDYNNRSSLAYMGTTDDQRDSHYNEVLERERREAEDEARNAENTWAKPDAPTDATKQEPEPVTVSSPNYAPPRRSNDGPISRDFVGVNPVPPSGPSAQQPHAPQYSSPLAPGPNERPYIPKDNDGAYHGPRPDQPPPRVVTPTFGTAPSSPSLSNPKAPAQAPTKPPMVRGESALGSKHGDIYVAGRTDGPQQFSSGGPVNVPGAPFVASPTSGYNTRGPDASSPVGSAPVTDASGRRVINAGAFRRAPGGPPSAGYAPPAGYDNRFAGAAPPPLSPNGAPSPADKIRDQYRAGYAEEDARMQPLQDGAPRFDTTPLNPQKRGSVPPGPGVGMPPVRPATTAPGPSDPAAWNEQVASRMPPRPMTPVANEPAPEPSSASASAAGYQTSPSQILHQQQQQQHHSSPSGSASGNHGVHQAVTRLD